MELKPRQPSSEILRFRSRHRLKVIEEDIFRIEVTLLGWSDQDQEFCNVVTMCTR
uniref:Uncharacterized protein n=1 Tax=Octopus bimaculoides TaxID=37653 RepID=A0A0L8GDN0_OCTBM